MKVIHLVTEDCYGAGKAAQRISNSVSKEFESKVFVLRNIGKSDVEVINVPRYLNFIQKVYRKLNEYETNRFSNGNLFHIEKRGIGFGFFLKKEKPDIIHIHYLNDGFFSYKLMNVMATLKIPVIWTLHDMWPFTGGCHYDQMCGQYKKDCSFCKQFTQKSLPIVSLKKKSKLFKDITWVGCSEWITKEFNNSWLGSIASKKCDTIPNPINMKFLEEYEYKNDDSKKIILFGAVNPLKDKRKGLLYLIEALKFLDKEKYKLYYFGDDLKRDLFSGFEVKSLGYINSEKEIIKIYRQAHVFVAPSIQENLANTVMESLACGTPTVAFDIGGMRDMICDGLNGYLTKPFDEHMLAFNIERAAKLKENYRAIQDFLRTNFSAEKVGKMYIDKYKQIISRSEKTLIS